MRALLGLTLLLLALTPVPIAASDDRHVARVGVSCSPFASRCALAQPALPDTVRGMLPADARIVEGFLADLTDDGERDWAILYVTPRSGSAFAADGHVTVIIATPDGWRQVLDVVEEYAPGGEVARASIGDRELLQVTFYAGAHSGSLRLYGWDGAGFALLLEEFSNAAAFAVGPTGVIVWFSPYCGSFASSPVLFRAWWWDGAGFTRDDGRDPDLLAGTIAEVEAAFARDPGATPSGRACLYDALAYLARAAGDAERVQQLCDAAHTEEPEDVLPRLVCG